MAVLWDGQSGCGVSDQAFVFETYSKNCSGLQSVVYWPQCWGEGSCSWSEVSVALPECCTARNMK